MQYFRQHPNELYKLDPRNFEELVAELFQGFGFDVELTAQTRDQGRDVIAIAHKPANIRFLIECKRYAAERAVGIAPVQRLLGVVTSEQATKGILVTTARRFTSQQATLSISISGFLRVVSLGDSLNG
jgi:restriction system protein